MVQCGSQQSRERSCIRVMSLLVPQAKTRHLVGDKNKPRRRKTEAPSTVGWTVNLCGTVCVRVCVCASMRGECPCFPQSRRTDSYTVSES